MGKMSQRKGAQGEQELTDYLRRAGYPVQWGGNHTYGAVPDVSGLPGIHIEVKRREQLNITEAMNQAVSDAARFRDGLPAVFHRRNNQPWLITMRLTDWLQLYAQRDHDPHARFLHTDLQTFDTGKEPIMPTTKTHFWTEEKPLAADTDRNHFEYFPRARKLSVGKPDWTDETGTAKRGKTVIVDLEALSASPDAINLLSAVLEAVKA